MLTHESNVHPTSTWSPSALQGGLLGPAEAAETPKIVDVRPSPRPTRTKDTLCLGTHPSLRVYSVRASAWAPLEGSGGAGLQAGSVGEAPPSEQSPFGKHQYPRVPERGEVRSEWRGEGRVVPP